MAQQACALQRPGASAPDCLGRPLPRGSVCQTKLQMPENKNPLTTSHDTCLMRKRRESPTRFLVAKMFLFIIYYYLFITNTLYML